jgi:ATP-dependent Lon protease
MKESAQIALSYLRSHGAELELDVGVLKDRGVHVHVPAGAVPKDGPSAGVHDDHRACVAPVRPAGPQRRGDDR